MDKPATAALFFLLVQHAASGSDLDARLDLVARVYALAPKVCESSLESFTSKTELRVGELLFEAKSLSGDRDISCSSCHLDQFGSADGLPLAVGVGGIGEGHDRLYANQGTLVQRNAISLFGRGSSEFSSFFWDGKVQVVDGRVITQFGDQLPEIFQSPLAVAAILPLIERDEFIGTSSTLRPNEIEEAVEDKLYFQRYEAVSKAIRQRLLQPATDGDRELADGLSDAGILLSEFELAHAGNLLAKFIAEKFRCQPSNWDRYLDGARSALSEEQKRGAILFYGKGRCASCHLGGFFSDFSFHSIGTPQGFFGPHSRHRDIGRAAVTHSSDDLFFFRTPPLIDVKSTRPYGHNGAFETMSEVVIHHFNPLEFYIKKSDYRSSDFFRQAKLIDSRHSILSTIDLESEDELAEILSFLESI